MIAPTVLRSVKRERHLALPRLDLIISDSIRRLAGLPKPMEQEYAHQAVATQALLYDITSMHILNLFAVGKCIGISGDKTSGTTQTKRYMSTD